MYEGVRICSELKQGEFCLVLEQYKEGQFEEAFHRHYPQNRISKQDKINLLRAFVIRFHGQSGMGAETIVTAFLNERGTTPLATDPFRIANSYPEPGVIRTYCGTNTRAWIDEIIAPTKFRTKAAKELS